MRDDAQMVWDAETGAMYLVWTDENGVQHREPVGDGGTSPAPSNQEPNLSFSRLDLPAVTSAPKPESEGSSFWSVLLGIGIIVAAGYGVYKLGERYEFQSRYHR